MEGNRQEPGPIVRGIFRYAFQRADEGRSFGFKTSFAPEALLSSGRIDSWRWNGSMSLGAVNGWFPWRWSVHAGALRYNTARNSAFTYRILETYVNARIAVNRRMTLIPRLGLKKQLFSRGFHADYGSLPVEALLLINLNRANHLTLGGTWEKYFIEGEGKGGLRYSPLIRIDYKSKILFSLSYQYYIYQGAFYNGREHRLRFNLALMPLKKTVLLLHGTLIIPGPELRIGQEQGNLAGLGERSNVYLKAGYDLSPRSTMFLKYIYENDRYKNDFNSYAWQILIGYDYIRPIK